MGIWRVFKRSKGREEDNILQVSCVDALEEPYGLLWCSAYTAGTETLRDVALPPPEKKAVRLGFWRCTFTIRPLHHEGECSSKVTLSMSFRPYSVHLLNQQAIFEKLKGILMNFRNSVKFRDLSCSDAFSHHATFFEHVRQHLVEKGVPEVLPQCEEDFSAHTNESQLYTLDDFKCSKVSSAAEDGLAAANPGDTVGAVVPCAVCACVPTRVPDGALTRGRSRSLLQQVFLGGSLKRSVSSCLCWNGLRTTLYRPRLPLKS